MVIGGECEDDSAKKHDEENSGDLLLLCGPDKVRFFSECILETAPLLFSQKALVVSFRFSVHIIQITNIHIFTIALSKLSLSLFCCLCYVSYHVHCVWSNVINEICHSVFRGLMYFSGNDTDIQKE